MPRGAGYKVMCVKHVLSAWHVLMSVGSHGGHAGMVPVQRNQWEDQAELSSGAQTLRTVLREDFLGPGDGLGAGPS